jgi:UDP-N-acetylglucosamine:LPS N-acetylglucosamine transferase
MDGNMKKILIVCGSGGHSVQALILHKQLGKSYNYEFMIDSKDKITQKKTKKFKTYKSMEIRGKNENIFLTIFRVLICSIQSIIILFRSWPDIIISTGPGVAIPITFLGKILGKKIIFIESWSRVRTKSHAGKIIYRYADLFFVQWPEMKKIYPNSIYAGRFDARDFK